MNFRITHGKGFYFGFENGWGVSVQFGPGNYAENYDMNIGKDNELAGQQGSRNAECAIITPEHEVFAHPNFDGDTVKGYCTPDQVMELLSWAQKQAPNAQAEGRAACGESHSSAELGAGGGT
jgi:hypothetical protein